MGLYHKIHMLIYRMIYPLEQRNTELDHIDFEG